MPLISQVFYVKKKCYPLENLNVPGKCTSHWYELVSQTVNRRKNKKVDLWRDKKKREMSKLQRCQRCLNSYFKLTIILLTLSSAYWLIGFHILFIQSFLCMHYQVNMYLEYKIQTLLQGSRWEMFVSWPNCPVEHSLTRSQAYPIFPLFFLYIYSHISIYFKFSISQF